MRYKQFLISLLKGLAALLLLAGVVVSVRYFCVESYRVATASMEEALHEGDCILVNKLPLKDNPGRNRVVLFTSPLLKDSLSSPLFLSRCIGMPGDTIQVNSSGYNVNGKQYPRSPRALSTYFITTSVKDEFMDALKKLNIAQRNLHDESYGFTLSLTSFEEYQLREELPKDVNMRFITEQSEKYTLIVPRKDRAYRLDPATLTACKEAILAETDGKAIIRDGKLFLDGRQTNFFFFRQDYYWMLSDNINEAVDSRHLGFIPADHILGNAWFCWLSREKQRIFKPVN